MRPWLRLDAGFFNDGKLIRAGREARWLWPALLARCKQADGLLDEEDLAADVLASWTGETPEWCAAAVAGLRRVELLVAVVVRRQGGSGGTHVRSGWQPARWDEYQPDARRPGRDRGATVEQRGAACPRDTVRDGGVELRVPSTGRDTTVQTPSPTPPVKGGVNKNPLPLWERAG